MSIAPDPAAESKQPRRHTFSALTDAQLEVLGNVAFGGRGAGCNRRTLEALQRKGLIERVEVTRVDGLGVFVIHKWAMPLPVHVDFCAWCDDEVRGTTESGAE